MSDIKNLLVCVTGLTPQIVTESLYCLSVKRKIKIDEIYVLTTVRGRDVIIGKDSDTKTPDTQLLYQINELCNTYNIHKPLFANTDKHIIVAKEESVELHDIRTDKQNRLFPNKAAEFIKHKTANPDTILYCSISGGRKTMSVHLANAISMFGRSRDKLIHVLTTEENEFKSFYPQTPAEDAALEIAEIPFIRLRSIISPQLSKKQFASKSYSDFVKFTEDRLLILGDTRKLLLNIPKKSISFGSHSIKLEPLQFAIYFQFIENRLANGNPISIHSITALEFAKQVKLFLEEYVPSYHLFESIKKPWWRFGFEPESFRSKRSKINNKLCELFEDVNLYAEFRITSIKDYCDTAYTITAPESKIKIIYSEF